MESGLSVTAVLGATQLDAGMAHARRVAPIQSKGSPWPLRTVRRSNFDRKRLATQWQLALWSASGRVHPGRMPSRAGGVGLCPRWVVRPRARRGTCRLLSADLVNPGFPRLVRVRLDYPEDRPNAHPRLYHEGLVPELMSKLLGAGTRNDPREAPIGFLEFLESELDPFIRSNII